jgi:hypothetical protein
MPRSTAPLAFLFLGLAGVTVGCASAGAVARPAADARVAVAFAEPSRFTDVSDSALQSETGRRQVLAELERFLVARGARHVPPGHRLEIRITDLDRAGEIEPLRGPAFDHVRIMREVYAPRIALEFALIDAGGAVARSGTRTLRDPLCLVKAGTLLPDDRLRYEKALLETWLREELGRPS